MSKRTVRVVAAGVALAVGALGLEMLDFATPASADLSTTLNLSCAGDTADRASGAQTSADILKLLGSALTLQASVTSNAPTKVAAGSGPFDASFTISLALPASVLTQARTLLGLSVVTVPSATFSVIASGAATARFDKEVTGLTIDLAGGASAVSQTLSGTITPTGTGQITYEAGTARVQIGLNATKPIAIGTLTVNCSPDVPIGITNVQIPGSPNINPGVITVNGTGGQIVSADLGAAITPDAGNPVLFDTLKITKGASAGFGLLRDGKLLYIGPTAGGTFNATGQVCGASRPIPEVPGTNLKQVIAFPIYPQAALNAHPITFTPQLGAAKAAKPVQLSYRVANILFGDPGWWTGGLVPTEPTSVQPDGTVVAEFLKMQAGFYLPPTAAAIQTSTESIPGVGFGNVKVTKVAQTATESARYEIEFVGALANTPLGNGLVQGDFNTWLPGQLLAVVTGALAGGGGAGGSTTTGVTTTTVVPDDAQTLAFKVASGAITLQQYLDGLNKRLAYDAGQLPTTLAPAFLDLAKVIFPPGPNFELTQKGKATVPASETGLLCSGFGVQFKLAAGPNTSVQAANVERCFKTVTSRVKVRVRGKTRFVRRTTRVAEVCCPKTVSKRVKVKVRGKTRFVTQRSTVQVACSTLPKKSRRR